MIHDVTERFRYRFDFWRRERREDLFGVPRDDPRTLREYSVERTTARWSDAKYKDMLTETPSRSVLRGIGLYFGIAIIVASICWFISGFAPSARHALAVVFVVFVCVWTLVTIIGVFDLMKARASRGPGR
jgi:hypothetical protein